MVTVTSKGLPKPQPCVPFNAQTLFLPTDSEHDKSLQQRLSRLETQSFLPQYHGTPWHPLSDGVVIARAPSILAPSSAAASCTNEDELNASPKQSKISDDENSEATDASASTQPVPLVGTSSDMTRTRDTSVFGGQMAMCSMYRWMMAKAYIAKSHSETRSKPYTHPLLGAATMQYPEKLQKQARRQTKRKRSSNHGSWTET